MTEFNIQKRTAFSIKGDQGTYTIKPIGQMSIEEIEEVSGIKDDTPLKEQAVLCRKFVLRECPDIGREKLGEMGYIEIVKAYFRYEQNGQNSKAGE